MADVALGTTRSGGLAVGIVPVTCGTVAAVTAVVTIVAIVAVPLGLLADLLLLLAVVTGGWLPLLCA
jgi:hypothetical protein